MTESRDEPVDNRPLDVEAAKTALLEAMKAAGIPEDRVVFGIVGDPAPDGGYCYETFVGATLDKHQAVRLSMIAQEIVGEAKQQVTTTYDNDRCPQCGSLRYGRVNRPAGPGRVAFLVVCMDCGHEQKAL